MKRVAVIGLGYVGLPLAMAINSAGYETIGFDINKDLIKLLLTGVSHVEDVDSNLLKDAINTGRLKLTSEERHLEDVEIYVITVPTPLTEDRKPDTSYVESAAEIIGRNISKNCLVINESTSYPGTLRNIIAPRVTENSRNLVQVDFAAAPERIDPGNSKWRIENTPRLVAGLSKSSSETTLAFYSKFCGEVRIVDTPEIAEIAKLFENTFRQVNIALVNEFSLICLKLGVDVSKALDAANTKPMGFMKFDPGIGVGGHCIPVDPTFLAFSAENAGYKSEFIQLSNEINRQMPMQVFSALNNYRSLKELKVLVIGLSYKDNISDIRESPGVEFLNILRQNNIQSEWYDPEIKTWNNESSSMLVPKTYDIGVYIRNHKSNDLILLEASCAEIVDLTYKLKFQNTIRFTEIGKQN